MIRCARTADPPPTASRPTSHAPGPHARGFLIPGPRPPARTTRTRTPLAPRPEGGGNLRRGVGGPYVVEPYVVAVPHSFWVGGYRGTVAARAHHAHEGRAAVPRPYPSPLSLCASVSDFRGRGVPMPTPALAVRPRGCWRAFCGCWMMLTGPGERAPRGGGPGWGCGKPGGDCGEGAAGWMIAGACGSHETTRPPR